MNLSVLKNERDKMEQGKLTDESLMPFGKYQNKKMIDVPAEYFLWFKDNVARNMSNDKVFDYINENLDVLKKEAK